MDAWKQRVRQLKTETYALYLACKDQRVPWYARMFAAFVVAYAFSPIDLIPDPIPVLGYLDDLLLVPLGLLLALKLIPEDVLTECRAKAQMVMDQGRPTNWVAAGVIVAIWLVAGALALALVVPLLNA
ncbi:MAG: DUF1232 domain-containing protein [Chloroflexi bacterium]|nr:DUF1232 domain-containing protein [Chloroflexota bacterium]